MGKPCTWEIDGQMEGDGSWWPPSRATGAVQATRGSQGNSWLQGQAREGSSREEAWVHLCVPQMTNVGGYILA